MTGERRTAERSGERGVRRLLTGVWRVRRFGACGSTSRGRGSSVLYTTDTPSDRTVHAPATTALPVKHLRSSALRGRSQAHLPRSAADSQILNVSAAPILTVCPTSVKCGIRWRERNGLRYVKTCPVTSAINPRPFTDRAAKVDLETMSTSRGALGAPRGSGATVIYVPMTCGRHHKCNGH